MHRSPTTPPTTPSTRQPSRPASPLAPLLAGLLLLAACAASEPTRFYALTPVTAEAPVAETDLVLGVAPISLASYLDRAGIVTRTSPNELGVSALHNWIEPLDTQARRTIARNLGVLLGPEIGRAHV